MSDQSFSRKTLERVLRKSDFDHRLSKSQIDTFREQQVVDALTSANTYFNSASNPLDVFSLKGRCIYRFKNLSADLVGRKLCLNLRRLTRKSNQGRTQIVECLSMLLQEGVPFRVYRLDIKGFYETFDSDFVRSAIQRITRLSPHSKLLLASLLEHHSALGGSGIPRGLSISAVLSEILMRPFDIALLQQPAVYFYARYVDDMIVITSGKENQTKFREWIQSTLPSGLKLNSEKEKVREAAKRVAPLKPGSSPSELFNIDYLGYAFLVREPNAQKNTPPGAHHRKVVVDIAERKLKKIKTRIVRSFIDYTKTGDWSLLRDRLKFLRQNFSVHNPKIGAKKVAGIFHSYPALSEDAQGLIKLDKFLRNIVLGQTGRHSSLISPRLNSKQRSELLSQSFVAGHRNRSFVHFSATRIGKIQDCWRY